MQRFYFHVVLEPVRQPGGAPDCLACLACLGDAAGAIAGPGAPHLFGACETALR